MTLTLFDLTIPIGRLPVGAKFNYAGWGDGTVTANDGKEFHATITYHGHQVATLTGHHPGEEVTPT